MAGVTPGASPSVFPLWRSTLPMQFSLTASGSNSDVREKLNDAVHNPSAPRTKEEDDVVRAIAHHVAAEILNPPYNEWQEQVNDITALRLKGSRVEIPAEPKLSLTISVSVSSSAAA